jgi:hypothetical protein
MGKINMSTLFRKIVIVGYVVIILVLIYANIWMFNYSKVIQNDCSKEWNNDFCPCLPLKKGLVGVELNLTEILNNYPIETP